MNSSSILTTTSLRCSDEHLSPDCFGACGSHELSEILMAGMSRLQSLGQSISKRLSGTSAALRNLTKRSEMGFNPSSQSATQLVGRIT